jgi:chromosomal replication initiator protein
VDNSATLTDLTPLWADISSALRSEVTPDIFDRWFKEVQLVEVGEEHLTLLVPNDIFRFWIHDNYIDPLRAAVLLVLKGAREIRFVSAGIAEVPQAEPEPARGRRETVEDEGEDRTVLNGFNSKNTFETFVVGANNEFVAAACRAISERPGKVYNPLFFYEGSVWAKRT